MSDRMNADDRMPNRFCSLKRWPNVFVFLVIEPPDQVRRLLLTEQDALKLYESLRVELRAAGLIKSAYDEY